MTKNSGYRNVSRQNKRGFTPDIRKDVNWLLDLYCRQNGLNKTHVVNEAVWEYLTARIGWRNPEEEL